MLVPPQKVTYQPFLLNKPCIQSPPLFLQAVQSDLKLAQQLRYYFMHLHEGNILSDAGSRSRAKGEKALFHLLQRFGGIFEPALGYE